MILFVSVSLIIKVPFSFGCIPSSWLSSGFKATPSNKSKQENILPLGLTDNAVLKKDINKDEVIKIDDVELSLPEDVVKARQYQYDLI